MGVTPKLAGWLISWKIRLDENWGYMGLSGRKNRKTPKLMVQYYTASFSLKWQLSSVQNPIFPSPSILVRSWDVHQW